MAQSQRKSSNKVSPAEYLERERCAGRRHEYDDGLITPREDAAKEHVVINTNLVGEIGCQLKGSSCRVFSAQMRVKVPQFDVYRYPDLSVACDAQFDDDILDTLLNPVVLVEIASHSTEALDRSRKWNQYRALPSLQDYVLISPTSVVVEQRHRADDGEHWWIRVLESLEDELVLDSINCRVRLADIYDGIELESDEPETDEAAESDDGVPTASWQLPPANLMKTTKIGIIGCGNISRAYFGTNAQFSFFDIVACADLNVDAARAKAEEWDIPKACSVDELLADPEIEFVINLTIPAAHGPVMLSCIEAGKSVYTEKPFTVTREEAQKIMTAASERGLRVGSAPDTFLGGAHQTVRGLIDSGEIGEVIAGTAFMAGHGHEGWHPSPAFYYQKGGGPMFDMGPYYLTDLVQLIGPVKRVAGAVRTPFKTREIKSEPLSGTLMNVEIPTTVVGTLEYENGAVVSMMTSFDVWGHDLPNLQLHGTTGSISVGDPNQFGGTPKIRLQGEKEWTEIPLTHGYTENARGIGMADMVLAMQQNRDHRCNERLAYHVLDTMHAFHDSSEQGRFIEMESTCERPAMLPAGLEDGQLDA